MNKNITIPKDAFLWSASKYNAWNQCNKCFWLKYIEKIEIIEDRTPYLYGSYIHESIEEIEKGNKPLDVSDLVLETKRIQDITNADFHLNEYLKIKKDRNMTNGVSELEFLIESEFDNPFNSEQKLFFYGFLDRVEFCNTEEKPQTIVVRGDKITCYNANGKEISNDYSILHMYEYKTKSTKWYPKAIRECYQFSMYQYICNKLNKGKGVSCTLINFIRGENPKVQIEDISRTWGDILKWDSLTRKTIEDIRDRKINEQSTCGFFCSYKDKCREYQV